MLHQHTYQQSRKTGKCMYCHMSTILSELKLCMHEAYVKRFLTPTDEKKDPNRGSPFLKAGGCRFFFYSTNNGFK